MKTSILTNWQPLKSLSFEEILSLPVRAEFTDTGRVRNLILIKIMRALIYGLTTGGVNTSPNVVFYQNNGTVIEDAQGVIGIPLSSVSNQAAYQSAIISAVASYAAGQGYTITDYVWGVGMNGSISRTLNYPTLAINTARQASATQDAFVIASVEIDASLSLTTGAKGTETFQIADDSGFTTNVVSQSFGINGNTGTLVIGLNTVGAGGGTIVGFVPAGKYYRIATANVTGTPTYGTPKITEILL